METLYCKLCSHQFDFLKHKPILFPCSHSICEKCLSKSLYAERSFFCPFDKQFIKLSQCRTNTHLLALIQKSSKENMDLTQSSSKLISSKEILKFSPIRPVHLADMVNDNEHYRKKSKNLDTGCGVFYCATPAPKKSEDVLLSVGKISQNKRDALNMSAMKTNAINISYMAHTVRVVKNGKEGKKRRRRKKSKMVKTERISLVKTAIIVASVVGGIYAFTKLKPKIELSNALNRITTWN
jgi:hypothetical protein